MYVQYIYMCLLIQRPMVYIVLILLYVCIFCVSQTCRAYHGHSKPLMGLSSYKMKQETEGERRISPNPNAWIVSRSWYNYSVEASMYV